MAQNTPPAGGGLPLIQLTCMYAQVCLQLRGLPEALGAEDADEGLQAVVDLLVAVQAAHVFEQFVALGAGQRQVVLLPELTLDCLLFIAHLHLGHRPGPTPSPAPPPSTASPSLATAQSGLLGRDVVVL